MNQYALVQAVVFCGYQTCRVIYRLSCSLCNQSRLLQIGSGLSVETEDEELQSRGSLEIKIQQPVRRVSIRFSTSSRIMATPLVFFVNCFDAALDKQRFSQRNLDNLTSSTFPKFLTPCKIEGHASDIYTRAVFNNVQIELYKAAWCCSIESVHSEGDVLLNTNVEKIPEKYIMRRWQRALMPDDLKHSRLRYGDLDGEQERMFNEVLIAVENCLGKLRGIRRSLVVFSESVRILKQEVDVSFPTKYDSSSKIDTIVDLIGVSQPENVEVYPPTGIRNNGWLVPVKLQVIRLQDTKGSVGVAENL
ncbi:hypothetical protein OSB04_028901 [Centaurea solstitialis]|uniref:Uncharacterized protein n=1 Tax=Centaurea solstitialis TaxID=347529 RepID=A0AA38SU50_9ASTR|nr:hypothetical protein OSB04_028901 [Centaurea solstitialis]